MYPNGSPKMLTQERTRSSYVSFGRFPDHFRYDFRRPILFIFFNTFHLLFFCLFSLYFRASDYVLSHYEGSVLTGASLNLPPPHISSSPSCAAARNPLTHSFRGWRVAGASVHFLFPLLEPPFLELLGVLFAAAASSWTSECFK